MIESRVTAWRPSMADYHADMSISSGFLSRVVDEGLSSALAERAMPTFITTDARMAKGNLLHAWLEGGHDVDKIAVASAGVKVKRGNRWEEELAKALRSGASSILTTADRDAMIRSWSSLLDPGLFDTPAKKQIRYILKSWTPKFYEVSHKWNPSGIESCWCRTREDIVARSPSGVWTAIQIKTTATPLARWWPYWRRYVRRSSAFYRASHRDLFREEPFNHLLIVGRTEPPYQWGLFKLVDYAEELDMLWQDDILPQLQDVTATLARGETYGPEERGLSL